MRDLISVKLAPPANGRSGPGVQGRNGFIEIKQLDVVPRSGPGDWRAVNIEGVSAKRNIVVNGGFYAIPAAAFADLCRQYLASIGEKPAREFSIRVGLPGVTSLADEDLLSEFMVAWVKGRVGGTLVVDDITRGGDFMRVWVIATEKEAQDAVAGLAAQFPDWKVQLVTPVSAAGHPFTHDELATLLEVARVSLDRRVEYAEAYEFIGSRLDLSDEALDALRSKLETYMRGDGKAPAKPKVIISVNGGVADVEEAPDGIEVEIRDYDNERR